MARERTLKLIIAGDADKLDRELKRSTNSLDKFGKQTRLTGSISSKGFSAMRVGATGAAAAMGGLVIGGKKVIDSASDIGESLSKNTVLFGRYAADIDKFSQTTATSLGISRAAALESAGTFGNLFSALELGPKKSADMSVALVQLAADMASFNNASPEETLDAIRSGLVGETEPLRRFGVNLADAQLRNEALRLGLVKTTKDSLEPQAKALAVNSLLFKQTEKAQGDFARTSGGAANQQKILNAQFSDAQAKLGGLLLPTFTKGIRTVNRFVGEMQDGTGQGGQFVDTLGEVADEARPIVTWIGRATKNIAQFTAEHPGVARLAGAVLAVGAAVKTLRFVSAVTGFTTLLKAGTSAGRLLRRRFVAAGTEAGVGAAASTAAGYTGGSAAIGGAATKAGKTAGRKFAAGVVIGLPLIVLEFKDQINKLGEWFSNSKIGKVLTAPMKLGNKIGDAINGLLGRNSGGIIPGQGSTDTVPAMLTPGEFVIRKRVVERFGPTFFSAINSGQKPQGLALGGKVQGLNPPFVSALRQLSSDTKMNINVNSGRRTFAEQTALWNASDKSGKWVARPGTSKHETGDAADIAPERGSFSASALSSNGLYFPMSWEPWHIQLQGGGRNTSRGSSPGVSRGSAPAGPSADELRDRRRSSAQRAGSRIANRIASRFAPAIGTASRQVASLQTAIDDAGTTYGQTERAFGQTDEDLGSAGGRAQRGSELAELKRLKRKTLGNQRKRAKALSTAIDKLGKQLKELRAARNKAKGPKRAKLNERITPVVDRLDDLKAELKALGFAIRDTELDIGDQEKEAGDVAATADTEQPASEAETPTDAAGRALSDIDLQERAGVITPGQAQAARIATLQQALAGGFGALDQRQQWELMGQLRDAQQQATQALSDLAAALADNTASNQALLAYANGVSAITSLQALRFMGDVLSREVGQRAVTRGFMPGDGQLARF